MPKSKAHSQPMTLQAALAQRIAHDDGQAAVAEKLGVQQSMVSRWLRGIDVPADKRIPALASYLNVSENEVAVMLSNARRRRQGIPERVTALEEEVQELGALVQALMKERGR